MDFLLPQISISPPPPEDPVSEPYSPFSSLTTPTEIHQDTFRAVHLTLPADMSTFLRKPLSPLRPLESVENSPNGLERERFEALLQASRERNALVGARKAINLRKEITLKAHKTKQEERRARFLSKILVADPQSPKMAPGVAPDSAEVYLDLPSPAPISPLTLPGSLEEDMVEYIRVSRAEPGPDYPEHGNMSPASTKHTEAGTGRLLPSLDQISARLTPQVRHFAGSRPTRLPDFLSEKSMAGTSSVQPAISDTTDLPSQNVDVDHQQQIFPTQKRIACSSTIPAILSPTATSYTAASRERRALDMLSTIGRRTQSFGRGVDDTCCDSIEPRKDNWKRHSAPADLTPLQPRSGFEHPVLALPGGF